jgi:pimeloyl-ACP methyl ester carboxylesterase
VGVSVRTAATLTLATAALAGRPREVTTADGVRLHVEEFGAAGAAGTVVLLHGYGQSSRLWAGQVRDLCAARPELRVVTYDHRGHGRSGRTSREAATIEQLARDLAAVLDLVSPDAPAVVAGHSMGGMTIMALAEQRPEWFGTRVAGAAFVATSSGELAGVTHGLPKPVAALLKKALPRLNEKALRDELAGKPRRVAPGTARLIFGPGAHPEDLRLTLEDMTGCSAQTVAYFLSTFDDHDRRAALAALADVPVVVLAGDRDRLCPLSHSQAIAAAIPHARLVAYPGAGHMVQLERRHQVSRQLVELVAEALPGAAPGAAPGAVAG